MYSCMRKLYVWRHRKWFTCKRTKYPSSFDGKVIFKISPVGVATKATSCLFVAGPFKGQLGPEHLVYILLAKSGKKCGFSIESLEENGVSVVDCHFSDFIIYDEQNTSYHTVRRIYSEIG